MVYTGLRARVCKCPGYIRSGKSIFFAFIDHSERSKISEYALCESIQSPE